MAKELTEFERTLLNKSPGSLTPVESAWGALRGFVRPAEDMTSLTFTDKAHSFLRRDGRTPDAKATPKSAKSGDSSTQRTKTGKVVSVEHDSKAMRQSIIDAICVAHEPGSTFTRTEIMIDGSSQEEILETLRALRKEGHLEFIMPARPGENATWKVVETLQTLKSVTSPPAQVEAIVSASDADSTENDSFISVDEVEPTIENEVDLDLDNALSSLSAE